MKKLTLGSLFDGIGGFPYAASLVGIEPIWAAEIEPFGIAVTKMRFPNMQHLGSVTEIHGYDIPPVDIISFGSPCQDLSVAGKRAGMKNEGHGDEETTRSGLFFEAIRIIYEMRSATDGKYPTFIIWENVPGAFSSNHGRDFQSVLSEITKTDVPMPQSGKWCGAGMVRGGAVSVAWRVFDAQFWGVPQRRKRIYLVGSFGSQSPEEILFKRDCVRGYLTQSGEPWQRATSDVESGVNVSCFDARGNGSGGIAPTMTGDHNGHISDYTAILAYSICSLNSNSMKSDNPHSGIYEAKTARTLDCNGGNPRCNQGGNVVVESYSVADNGARRLTPLECERLQGYPDNWTQLPKIENMTDDEYDFYLKVYMTDKAIRGKATKVPSQDALIKWYNKLDNDGNRYKASGNSLAIPCALRVMEGIEGSCTK